MNNKTHNERYRRQLSLQGFGEAAQDALLQARVLVIGAGGLGCPVLQYLTAAGIGFLGIVDNDLVSMTNLHRQVLYDEQDIGKPKVLVAAAKLRLMNPDTAIDPLQIRLNKNNCLQLIAAYDVVVDCTDNFASRYMINDACVLKGKPLVYGAISRFEGQLAVFNVLHKGKASGNYRHLFPQQPLPGEVMNCAEAGVLGVLPGIIGTMQANEAIKLITGYGKPLADRLLTFNAIDNRQFIYHYSSKEPINIPAGEAAFLQMDYAESCTVAGHIIIDAATFDALLQQPNTCFIDVRETGELPPVTEFETIRIPLGVLKKELPDLKADQLIFYCQSGNRSRQAAIMAAGFFGDKITCYSLAGGIPAWKKMHENPIHD